MKTTFVCSVLCLVVAYPLALLAETIGLFGGAVAALPVFISGFIACGLLTLLSHDYRSPSTRRSTRTVRVAPQTQNTAATLANDSTAWVHHTLSA